MRMIVKIQAVFRGVLTRKWVQHVYGFVSKERFMDPNLVVYY